MSPACRVCHAPQLRPFIDLGPAPLANGYLRADQLGAPEVFYPLTTYLCDACRLVQLPAVKTPAHFFSEYPYFSSYSDGWLAQAKQYADVRRTQLALNGETLVVEIGSNDGYLLQYFAAAGVPVLGIEPAANVAAVARHRGVNTITRFFGAATAHELAAAGQTARLLVVNNVLAHAPDLHDFVEGLRILLQPDGLLTIEVPHLLRLMAANQFDTIYHEHCSYFSLETARRVLAAHGLIVVDVEERPTHGGSLRIHGRHVATAPAASRRVASVLASEREYGLHTLPPYEAFAERIRETKRALLTFLVTSRRAGRSIAGYGAPAKANTLLNYCGVRTDFIDYTVDRNPHKQGMFLPGTHIPIHAPDRLRETKPDFVMILPWNLRDEIVEQLADIRSWGGRLVVAIPHLEVLP